MDALDHILKAFPVAAVLYCRLAARQPWGLAVPKSDDAYFHAVRSGQCFIRIGPADPVELRAGEFVILPRGQAHDVLGDPSSAVTPLDEAVAQAKVAVADDAQGPILPLGADGAAAKLLCGAIQFSHRQIHPILRCLPDWVHLRAGASSVWPLDSILETADREIDRGLPGSEVVLARLADIVIIEALRAYIHAKPKAAKGLLAALADERLGSVLRELHADPSRKWQLEDLASLAGMSRSAFTSRFRAVLGESPLRYLTRWRLAGAARQLENDEATVSEIAVRAGYRSRAAFSRAFAREFGVPPGQMKQAAESN